MVVRVRQQLYVRKLSNNASKDLPVKLWNEGKRNAIQQCKQLPHSQEVESGFHQCLCSGEKFLASRPPHFNSPHPGRKTLKQHVYKDMQTA